MKMGGGGKDWREKIDVIEMFAQEIERLFYRRLSAIKHFNISYCCHNQRLIIMPQGIFFAPTLKYNQGSFIYSSDLVFFGFFSNCFHKMRETLITDCGITATEAMKWFTIHSFDWFNSKFNCVPKQSKRCYGMARITRVQGGNIASMKKKKKKAFVSFSVCYSFVNS